MVHIRARLAERPSCSGSVGAGGKASGVVPTRARPDERPSGSQPAQTGKKVLEMHIRVTGTGYPSLAPCLGTAMHTHAPLHERQPASSVDLPTAGLGDARIVAAATAAAAASITPPMHAVDGTSAAPVAGTVMQASAIVTPFIITERKKSR